MTFLYAILWAVAVTIVAYLLGAFLEIITPVVALGTFLQSYAWLIGLAAGIFYFVGNGRFWNK